MHVVPAIFCFADTNKSARDENALRLVMEILSASVSDPDKKSWDIMHPGIFLALTKQLPLKVPGKGCIKGNQVQGIIGNIKVAFMNAAILTSSTDDRLQLKLMYVRGI